ncbi:MAG: SirB2 family protein [Gammaproteobacteria bacterium]|nr:SirB2 family protein [Gammaproteobacteria bacterium]
MLYLALKHVHVGCVVISISLFVLRYLGQVLGLSFVRGRLMRTLPHAIDSILLLAALGLAALLHQYPFVHTWLTAKVLALIAYIGLGSVALKRGRNAGTRFLAFLLALATVGYILSVARTHSPYGFLLWLGL